MTPSEIIDILESIAPPPWKFVLTGDERGMVFTNGPYGRIVLAEDIDQYDGNLIAAAPELLNALFATIDDAKAANKNGEIIIKSEIVDLIQQAINKSGGVTS